METFEPPQGENRSLSLEALIDEPDYQSFTDLSSPRPFHGDYFHLFNDHYTPIHGYISLFVCIFGIIANILNIVVLTRKEMQSATNAILTGLAVADLLVMIDYIPFTIHMHIRTDQETHEKYSYSWALFTLCHAHFSVVLHSISTWLTVILAVWRYTSVSFPTQSRVWCSLVNAKKTIGLTYFIVPIICFPIYLSFTIRELKNYSNAYSVDWSDISRENNELLKKIDFWLFSVGLKLVPCLLLTYLSLALIRVLIEAEKRKERLKSNLGIDVKTPLVSLASKSDVGSKSEASEERRRSSTSTSTNNNQMMQMVVLSTTASSANHKPSISSTSNLLTVPSHKSHHQLNHAAHTSSNCHQVIPDDESCVTPTPSSVGTVAYGSQGNQTNVKRNSRHGATHSDRTTRMLLAILILFLVTEMPSGLLALASGILGEEFFQSVYHPLGNILDILALINSGINFILYCCMSRLFRTTFAKVFCVKTRQNPTPGLGSPSQHYPPSPSTAIHVLESTNIGNNFRNRRKSSGIIACSNIVVQSIAEDNPAQQTSEV